MNSDISVKELGINAKIAANKLALIDNDKKNAVTILCDRGERYFSCL